MGTLNLRGYESFDDIQERIEEATGEEIFRTKLLNSICELVLQDESLLEKLIQNRTIRKDYTKSKEHVKKRRAKALDLSKESKALNRQIGANHAKKTCRIKQLNKREAAIKASSEWYRRAGIPEDFEEDLRTVSKEPHMIKYSYNDEVLSRY